MKIPNPVANYGELVLVNNYRARPKNGSRVWEEGTVAGLRYETSYGGDFCWKYDIRLKRKTPSGRPLFLYVTDRGVKKQKGATPLKEESHV